MGAQFVGQRTQLLHLAQAWVDRPVVADRIAAVVLVGRSGKKWHQMQVSQTQLLKIGDPGAQALQIPGEQIDITDASQHLFGLVPERVPFACVVQRLEWLRAIQPGVGCLGKQALQVVQEVIAFAVQGKELCKKVVEVGIQAASENCPAVRVAHGGEFCFQARQQAGVGTTAFSAEMFWCGHVVLSFHWAGWVYRVSGLAATRIRCSLSLA